MVAGGICPTLMFVVRPTAWSNQQSWSQRSRTERTERIRRYHAGLIKYSKYFTLPFSTLFDTPFVYIQTTIENVT